MKWTTQKKEWLRDLYPDNPNDFIAEVFGCSYSAIKNQAVKMGLSKSRAYLDTKPGCFKRGHKTWNKGKEHRPAGSERGQFKAGHKPHTWKPIGHERLTKDGIWQRKVTDTGVTRRDYQAIHKLIWEEVNGPVPECHIVIFVDGNRENFDPANLECITRAENMHRNSVHRLPKELAEMVQLMGALNRQINKRAQP